MLLCCCCRRAPSDIYYPTVPQAQHNTAQRSQPAQAAKQVRADQSATKQASRLSRLEPTCRRAFVRPVVFSKRTKKSKSPRPTQYTIVHFEQLINSCCDAQRVWLHTTLSLRPFHFVHACGVPVVFVDHGALGICKSPVCT